MNRAPHIWDVPAQAPAAASAPAARKILRLTAVTISWRRHVGAYSARPCRPRRTARSATSIRSTITRPDERLMTYYFIVAL